MVFLDEFGHIGPFIARADKRYNQSPVFGLAGFIMPHQNVTQLSTWFFGQKNFLLGPEIKRSGKHPATWEKKGNDLFTTRNIKKYPDIFRTSAPIIGKINRLNGKVFFYGRERNT